MSRSTSSSPTCSSRSAAATSAAPAALERWLARADIAREAGDEAPRRGSRARFGLDGPAGRGRHARGRRGAAAGRVAARRSGAPARRARHARAARRDDPRDHAATRRDALVAALREHFAPDGLEFHVPRPDRWYVRVPRRSCPSPRRSPRPSAATSSGCCPTAPGASTGARRSPRRRCCFATHPVNLAREAAAPARRSTASGSGARARCPPTMRSPYGRVYAGDPFARGLGASRRRRARARARVRLAAIDATRAPALVVDSIAASARSATTRWFATLARGALARFGTVRADPARARATRSSRRSRRARALALLPRAAGRSPTYA